jgi:hypothetical protein
MYPHQPRCYRRKLRRVFVQKPVLPAQDKYLLTPAEAAAAVGVSLLTLHRWRKDWRTSRQGPEPIRFSKSVFRYRIDEVLPPAPGAPNFLERMQARAVADIDAEATTKTIAGKESK